MVPNWSVAQSGIDKIILVKLDGRRQMIAACHISASLAADRDAAVDDGKENWN